MSNRIIVIDDSKTVRLVVKRTLSKAGYEVDLASSGEEALAMAKANLPDLFIVDVVMPHMDGVEFCKHLRTAHPKHSVPIVLMSARTADSFDEVLRATSAADAISKPFGPEALRTVVAKVFAYDSVRPPKSRPPSSVPPPLAIDGALASIGSILGAFLGNVVRDFTGTSTPTNEQLARAISQLDADVVQRMVRDLEAASLGAQGTVAFSGRGSAMPIFDILQVLEHQRRTGSLFIRNEGRVVQVVFGNGCIDIAISNSGQREFLLGRYLLEEEALTPDALDDALANRNPNEWLGSQLVSSGTISEDHLRKALVRQTSELMYEALRWRDADYHFEPSTRSSHATHAQLGLPMAQILMEGLRRIDEWRLIEERISSFSMVPIPRADAIANYETNTLTDEENLVLSSVNGIRSVTEIVEHTRMSSFDACRILFRLITSGLVSDSA